MMGVVIVAAPPVAEWIRVVTGLGAAVVFVIGPQLSGMIAQRAFGRARGVYQAATMWLSAISFPFYLALAAFAPLMLRLFGEKFTQGATALMILSLAMLVNIETMIEPAKPPVACHFARCHRLGPRIGRDQHGCRRRSDTFPHTVSSSFTASSTSTAWPGTRTRRQIRASLPSTPNRKVARSMPI